MAEVTVVPFTRDHLDEVQAMLADPEVLAFTPVPEPPPPAHAERWLARQHAVVPAA